MNFSAFPWGGNRWSRVAGVVTYTVAVGEEVTFYSPDSGVFGLAEPGSGVTRLNMDGRISWGDKTVSKFSAVPNMTKHCYDLPGVYTARMKQLGQFTWSAEEGSCSYECSSPPREFLVHVVTEGSRGQCDKSKLTKADPEN